MLTLHLLQLSPYSCELPLNVSLNLLRPQQCFFVFRGVSSLHVQLFHFVTE